MSHVLSEQNVLSRSFCSGPVTAPDLPEASGLENKHIFLPQTVTFTAVCLIQSLFTLLLSSQKQQQLPMSFTCCLGSSRQCQECGYVPSWPTHA